MIFIYLHYKIAYDVFESIIGTFFERIVKIKKNKMYHIRRDFEKCIVQCTC